jgi:hypothetical protein
MSDYEDGRTEGVKVLLNGAAPLNAAVKISLNSRDITFSSTSLASNVIVGSSRKDCPMLTRVAWRKDPDGNILALLRQ